MAGFSHLHHLPRLQALHHLSRAGIDDLLPFLLLPLNSLRVTPYGPKEKYGKTVRWNFDRCALTYGLNVQIWNSVCRNFPVEAELSRPFFKSRKSVRRKLWMRAD